MTKVCIDTDIIIDYLRMGYGVLEELLELASKNELELVVSSVTILELFSGETKPTQSEILKVIEEKVTVVALDSELARFVGKLRRATKHTVALPDLIIGGSTLYLGAVLATRNTKHFEQIPGIKLWRG